ncbi:MAG: hypothetical protein Q8Q08_08440 [Candidatus Omnitrophota bacterium]|nr:hypothetical protein [Candidatus Omnitrophota bacterium]MDZ4241713.1 hypothetical protein [Candidatus Omnitrophota bacterium]
MDTMFRPFQKWREARELRRTLLEFHSELRKNLESFYVMDQLGRLRPFRLEAWSRVSPLGFIGSDENILRCFRAMEEHNRLLEDFSNFEAWYSSDLDNKTQANARILHEKRDAPQKNFPAFEGLIKAALSALEAQLQSRKVLKH